MRLYQIGDEQARSGSHLGLQTYNLTMNERGVILLLGGTALLLSGLSAFVRWGSSWGSTREERQLALPGDRYLAGSRAVKVAMTRAITIRASPELIWPWLAQLGRGAGWYSVERLDNGGRLSARHIVSWIPTPELGDASPIGYLRHLEPGRALAWWTPGLRFAGAWARLAVDICLIPTESTSRLVIRMSADATGSMARVALLVFRFIDTIMARRQLLEIRKRVEQFGARTTNPDEPETGARDQYQLYEAIYASGESVGVSGRELAAKWRQAAIDDGVLVESLSQQD